MAHYGENDAYRKLVEAIINRAKAEKEYEGLISRFVASGPVGDFQPLPEPKRVFDIKGLKEIKEAQAKVDEAEKDFRKALDDYFKSRK